jgi:hypothetical protein
LIVKNSLLTTMEFSRCARAPARPTETNRPPAGLSKLNSETSIDVDRRGRR